MLAACSRNILRLDGSKTEFRPEPAFDDIGPLLHEVTTCTGSAACATEPAEPNCNGSAGEAARRPALDACRNPVI